MLIKREVMEKIGGLDLRFGMGNFEDDDYCMRALLAGFKCQIARDCFVHHYGGRTFKSAGIDYGKAIMTNWEIFRKKWNLPEAGEGNNSYDIRHFLSQPFTKVRHYFPLGPEEFTVELGEALYLAGDVDGAKLCLDKVLERDPSNVEALNNLGFIAFQEGNLSQALSYLEEGLKINPDSCEILENLGQIYISKGDFSRAAAYLERALKLEPENVNLINNLANCLVQTGSHLAAESLYERSYELDRSQEHVREILALLKEIKGAQVGARA
jgi:tetratricopeptide (TPR) repeat protein